MKSTFHENIMWEASSKSCTCDLIPCNTLSIDTTSSFRSISSHNQDVFKAGPMDLDVGYQLTKCSLVQETERNQSAYCRDRDAAHMRTTRSNVFTTNAIRTIRCKKQRRRGKQSERRNSKRADASNRQGQRTRHV